MGASSHASSYYHDALSFHVLLQVLYQLQLLVNGKPANDHLQDRTHADVVFSNKTAIIDVGEHAHEELAVHAIGHPSMTRDAVAKILDVEGTLETRRKETSEWRHERCKNCKN